MRVIIVAHDLAWQGEFEKERSRIAHALGKIVVLIHHIGSTAIPGIFAKPIIDILLEVEDIVQLDEKSSSLEGLGYEAMGEFGLPGRRYFRKNNGSGIRTHQVHAYSSGDSEAKRHLAFRDYLIAHPAEAQTYNELKQKLASANSDDIEAYMDGKEPFIAQHEANALAWLSAQASQ